MTNSIHLPGLNGLRAIAALSVMWGHTFQKDFGNWGITGLNMPLVADGVTLFFVISGFLITYLLLHEQHKSNNISIPKFYMRRILRIWPIYYLYLLIAIFVTSTYSDPNIWFYCFFTANIPFILTAGIWPIVHYWSLGVEEQFYLFWPWLIKATHGKNQRLLIVSILLCLVWLCCKWGLYLTWGTTTAYRFFSVTRFDCMMLGAIGAILFYTNNKLLNKVFGNRLLGAVCLVLLCFSATWVTLFPAPVRAQVIAILSLACIVSQLHSPIINLENKVCDFVGKISYGIYVIHPLLIFLLSSLYRNAVPQLPHGIDITVIYLIITSATILIAWLSYRYFENPFLRLKSRFAIVHSQNTMN